MKKAEMHRRGFSTHNIDDEEIYTKKMKFKKEYSGGRTFAQILAQAKEAIKKHYLPITDGQLDPTDRMPMAKVSEYHKKY